jgi:hypothetical protein
VRSEDSLAQEILKKKDTTYVYRRGYFDFVLAKEASWGGDRKIKETIIVSPERGIPKPSLLTILSTLRKKEGKRRENRGWFCLSSALT